ncbi:MAG: VCBS repeat-containing protein [Planctomycetes bacterium]|nr:VCBS repeat-containing protein [Planctomycetota bacterium]
MSLRPHSRSSSILLGSFLGMFPLLALGARDQPPSPEKLEKILHHHNRGVAFMERFEPEKAVEEFRQVARLLPQWTPGVVNLAIALLNTQKEKDLEECQDLLRALQKKDPKNPYAHYSLGMLFLHRNRLEEAAREFGATRALDPLDPHTLYQLGSLARQAGRLDEAEGLFKQAISIHAGLSSAWYGLARIALSKGQREEGKRLLERFSQLERAKVGVKVSLKYGEMGRYAEIIRMAQIPGAPAPAAPIAPGWRVKADLLDGGGGRAPDASPQPAAAALAARLGPTAALADVDGDHLTDLFLAAAAPGRDRLLLGRPDGRFLDRTQESGLEIPASQGSSTAAAFGDYDGDGRIDLFVARTTGCILYQNRGTGPGQAVFADVTAAAGIDAAGAVYSSASFADADHDGDLDLFLAGYALLGPLEAAAEPAPARSRLLINLRTGRFEDRAEAAGITACARARGAFFSDLDGDRAIDLFVAVENGPPLLYRNGRALQFREAAKEMQLQDLGHHAFGAAAADLNGDGFPEIILLRGPDSPPLLLRNQQGRRFEPASPLPEPAAGATAVAAADFNLDGFLDLALSIPAPGDRAMAAILLGDGRGELFKTESPAAAPAGLPSGRALPVLDLGGDGSLDLLFAGAGAPLAALESVPPAGQHWLRIELEGHRHEGEYFSNRQGTGALVEAKAGDRWTVVQAGTGGASEAAVHVGLGPQAQADYVRIVWPDGILQSEMELAADRRVAVEQVQRKSSSCPLLFTWDGERFRFVTDLLGTGGLGFFLRPGEYIPPDPTEDLRIPPGALAEKEGRLRLRIVEPLEEVCYLDQLQLLAVDHPEEAEVYPEERFGGSQPAPWGRLLLIEEKIFPQRALDRSGREVTPLLLEVDRRWPSVPRDPRFPGYAEEHWLALEFKDLPAGVALDGSWFLFLDGWVEYTYSHVNYAAWQAGLALRPPALEVPDGKGGWKTAISDAGYPAGLPRTMAVPLPRDALAAGKFRLRTNMEIYWDRAFIARDESEAPAGRLLIRALPLASARLSFYGFPQEFFPDGQAPPLYDYGRRDPGVFFRNLPGDYTRMGEVGELLEKADDRMVIFGRGDEVAADFDSRSLPPLPPRSRRTYVLRSFGYCKDKDFHTACSDSVHPLPFQAMSGYPYPAGERYPDDSAHRRYLEEWNTRKILDR